VLQLRLKLFLLGGIGRVLHLLPNFVEQVRAFLHLRRFDGSAFPALREESQNPGNSLGGELLKECRQHSHNPVDALLGGTHFRSLRTKFSFSLQSRLDGLSFLSVLNRSEDAHYPVKDLFKTFSSFLNVQSFHRSPFPPVFEEPKKICSSLKNRTWINLIKVAITRRGTIQNLLREGIRFSKSL
jgi:hypothetical protein